MEKEKLSEKYKMTLEKLGKLWPGLNPVQKAYFLGKADGYIEAEMMARVKEETAVVSVITESSAQPRG